MRQRSAFFCLISSFLAFLALPFGTASAADTTPPTVIRLLPETGASVVELRQIEVFFSEDVQGVDASDLRINGVAATNLSPVTASQYRFAFSQPATGLVQIAWAAGHGITDLAVPPNSFAGGSWTYKLNPSLALNDVRINEFLADNQTGIRDEDGTYQDWIELYNDSTIAVDLGGCFLTDTKLKLDLWRFPVFTLPSKSYLIVWASNKDRTNPAAPLHTNFRLDSGGEYLALLGPQTNVISAFDPAYPSQRPDVSYGRDPLDPSIVGYYSKPTPGAFNSVSNAPSGADFTADVQFSQPSGTFVNPFNLVLATAATNAVIRYVFITNFNQAAASLTNVPSTNSPIYSGPIPINLTTQIRARAFEPGKLPSTPLTFTYIQISTNLVNFTSDLPMFLFTTFGSGGIQSSGDGTGYCMIFDNALDRTSLTNPPDLTARMGVNDRGSSTAGQPKNNMAVEFWDEFNQDLQLPFLDMPAQSDWVFYGIDGFDPGLMHNAIFYWVGRQLNRYSSRTRYVEVFRKTDGGPVTSNDYWGLYLVEEKPKRDKHRVDIENLQPENSNAPSITGGYLLKIDRQDSDEVSFLVPTVTSAGPQSVTVGGQGVIFVNPNLTPASAADPRRVLQRNYIQNYFANFMTNLASASFTNPITGYAPYLDIDSWVENHIANNICFNVDTYRLSGYFFKDRSKPIEQGPPWDCDRCLGTGGVGNTPQADNRPFNPRIWRTYTTDVNSDQGTDFFGRSSVGVNWWNRLFRDPDFWQRWIDRYQALRTNEYSSSAFLGIVDSFYNEIKEAQVREQARWAPPPVGRQGFNWPRAGLQTVTTSAGGFTSSYTFDFGPTNPASTGVKVGYFTNEVNFQKKWLLDRLEFIDTNFLAM
ncbi:MAG TPA: CotH kinase family protein, partial [Candidatus Binatia bacterium]|nr:CotH kinase family protein [Candidatus Binatia bacterium]